MRVDTLGVALLAFIAYEGEWPKNAFEWISGFGPHAFSKRVPLQRERVNLGESAATE